jgi:hypothetical protein
MTSTTVALSCLPSMLGKERAITVRSRDDPLNDEVASAVQQKATTSDAITA